MFTNLIENRGREFSNLIKIGDYLSRTLRENVELFSVDNGTVTYLTESGSILKGDYTFKPELKLTNIMVEDASVLKDQKVFEQVTNKQVSNLLGNLMQDDYQQSEESFDDLLGMFETKLSYDRIERRLQEKTQRFGESTNIVNTPEFQRANEIKDKIVNFLKEGNIIEKSAGIRNGMKLATLVSTSFDLPKMTTTQLAEAKTYKINLSKSSSIYEHLCRSELIQKELLEAKSNFDSVWVDSASIQDLASMVYENSEENLRHQVAVVVSDNPYFGLASKKQLNSIISNSLSLAETKVSKKDISAFASKIFEMKRPVKKYILSVLNEKYGIDVSKLTEVPSFNTLLKTEAEIIKAIANHASKGSVVKSTLNELANVLKVKNGAESIDVADFLADMFLEADQGKSLNETSLMSYLDFTRVADDLGKIGQVLKMLVPAVQDVAQDAEQMAGQEMQPGQGEQAPQMPLGSPDPMDSSDEAGIDPMDTADAEPAMPDAQETADAVNDEADAEEAMANGDIEPVDDEGELPPEEGEEGELPPEEGEEGELPPEEGFEGEEGELPPEEGFEGEEEGELPPEEGEEEMGGEEVQDELTGILSKVQALLADLVGDEDSEMEGEEEGFEEEGEEEEEGFEEEEEEDEEDKLDPEQYKS